MYLILNNISPNKLYLALSDQQKILYYQTKALSFGQGEKLLFILDSFLKKHRIKIKDIQGLIVNLGPGSFTSLRLSLLLANAFSYVQKIPLYGFKKDKFENLSVLLAGIKNKKPQNFLEPYYGQEPNITKPKKKF